MKSHLSFILGVTVFVLSFSSHAQTNECEPTQFYEYYSGQLDNYYYYQGYVREGFYGYAYQKSVGSICTIEAPGTVALYRYHTAGYADRIMSTDYFPEGFGEYTYSSIAGYVYVAEDPDNLDLLSIRSFSNGEAHYYSPNTINIRSGYELEADIRFYLLPDGYVAEGIGTQSRCDLTDSAEELLDAPLDGLELIINASPTEAFCVGLQSHGDENSLVDFADGYSLYAEASDSKIMAKNVHYSSAGHGNTRCLTNNIFVAEGCDLDKNPALELLVPDHPDYNVSPYSGYLTSVPAWTIKYIGPGNRAGITTGRNVKLKLTNSGTYRMKTLSVGDYSEIRLNTGDYFIENLSMGHHSKIVVDGGTARLFVKNNVSLSDYITVNWPKDPSKLMIIADGDFSVKDHSSIFAYLYAKGDVSLYRYSTLEGAVNADNIKLNIHSRITEDLSTIGKVNFTGMAAKPAPYDASLVLEALSSTRHSGTYELDYENSNVAESEVAYGNIHFGLVIASPFTGVLPIIGFVFELPISRMSDDTRTALDELIAGEIAKFDGIMDNPIHSYPIGGSYYHAFLSGSFATPEDRDAAIAVEKQNFADTLYSYGNDAQKDWNRMFDSVAETVTYDTLYFSENKGVALSRFDNAGGWLSAMDDNKRYTVPVFWPIAAIGVAAVSESGFAIAGCLAWISAFEAGCFAPDPGEPYECKQNPDRWPNPQSVDLSLNAYANAELTCGVVTPVVAIVATIGMGISAEPTGNKIN